MTIPPISKKLAIAVIAMLAVACRNWLELDSDQVEALMVIAGAYTAGQGLADFGKGKAQVENGHKPATPGGTT